MNTQSTSKETSNNTDISSFTQASNTSIVNPRSTSKETSNNTAITSFTQASNTSIVNPSSPITVSTTSTNITTTTTTATATSSSIEGGYAILDQMELSSFRSESERAIFGPSTSTRVTSRNTLGNSKIETVLVDVHRGRDKSTESDDNNNHLDLVKKRRKVQKGGRPKKTNLNKTNSNDSELSESEDISKQPRPRGPQGKIISKQNKDANDASVNIVGENSCVLESNASVKGVRGRGRPRLNKLAQNILEHNAEKEKNRQAQITKDKDRLPVGTRTQPPREAVANAAAAAVAAAARKEFSVVHSDSEDMAFASDSDISDDSNSNYCFTDMVNSMGEHYSDTELQETDVDEEIIENLKKAKKI